MTTTMMMYNYSRAFQRKAMLLSAGNLIFKMCAFRIFNRYKMSSKIFLRIFKQHNYTFRSSFSFSSSSPSSFLVWKKFFFVYTNSDFIYASYHFHFRLNLFLSNLYWLYAGNIIICEERICTCIRKEEKKVEF